MGFKRELIGVINLIYLASLCLSVQSYSIQIENLVLSPGTDPTWFSDYTLRTTKIAKNTFAVSGGFSLLKNIGNDMQMTLVVYKKDKLTGNYLSAPTFIMTSAACKLYDEAKIVDDIIAASNLPPKGTCPIPKDQYNLKDFKVTEESLPSYVPGGEYKMELSISKEQKLISSINLAVTVYPA